MTEITRAFLIRLAAASGALALLSVCAVVGYGVIDGWQHDIIDYVYMVVITVTTIGYHEIVDLQGHQGGRVFNMIVALSGVLTMTFVFSTITAYLVEGELGETFRRRRMQKQADRLDGHYIVCGGGRIGEHIVGELMSTGRECIVIDALHDVLDTLAARHPGLVTLDGDATEDEVLSRAGVERAAGLFAATAEDNTNLVIALTSRQMAQSLRVVTRCGEAKNQDKLRVAGADRVVTPSLIGGMRMASEMVRPTAVSFMDVMLRDSDKNLRIEEFPVAGKGRTVAELGLETFPQTLLLAVRTADGWVYNPEPSHELDAGDALVVMTTPEERLRVGKHVAQLG